MGFGVVIGSGTSNTVIDVNEALIEVRVEQSLGEPTTFAVRFRDDICDNQFVMSGRPEFKPDTITTIAVRDADDDKLFCLVRGPIIEAKASYTLGGPGSFFEVRGQDGRNRLADAAKSEVHRGSVTEIATGLLASVYPNNEVQSGLPTLGDTSKEGGGTVQSSTPLEHLNTLARETGAYLWVTYTASMSKSPPPPTGKSSLSVVETAHFGMSPKRGSGTSVGSLSLSSLLPDKDKVELDGGTSSKCGPNITAFEANENWAVVTSAQAGGVDARSANSATQEAKSPDQLLKSGGVAAAALSSTARNAIAVGAGNAEANARRAESALSDQGWYVTARASSSLHMLHQVVEPHTILNVTGIGPLHSMPFQVTKVTHVITAANHMMDMDLRTNQHIDRSKGVSL
jgi:hypothetical protein